MPNQSTGGTLMILTSVKAFAANTKVVGHHRIEERPDPIGVPTIKRSARFLGPRAPKRIPVGLMRVRVIDATGKVLSTQIIDDPLDGFYEVAHGLKGEEAFWTKGKEAIESFLVAVPNIKEAQRILFTRYTNKGFFRHSGLVDWRKDPIKKPLLRAQVSNTFLPTDAEYDAFVDNGAPENRFDMLILAEGYQNLNLQRDKFRQDVINATEGLWSIPIYAEFQDVMNVHSVFLPSVDSGCAAADCEQLVAARQRLGEKLAPIDDIFENQLKPRLDKIPTRKQRAAVKEARKGKDE